MNARWNRPPYSYRLGYSLLGELKVPESSSGIRFEELIMIGAPLRYSSLIQQVEFPQVRDDKSCTFINN